MRIKSQREKYDGKKKPGSEVGRWLTGNGVTWGEWEDLGEIILMQ